MLAIPHSRLQLSPALSAADRAAAFRLRYRAYRATDVVPADPSEQVRDHLDDSPFARTYLMTSGERLVGTIRSNVHRPGVSGHRLLIQDFWPRLDLPWLGGEDVVIESSRLAIDPDYDDTATAPFLRLFAAHNANAVVHGARYIVTVVTRRHSLFYRRRLGMVALTDPLEVAGMNVEPAVILALDHTARIAALEAQFPDVAVTAAEARLLAVPTPAPVPARVTAVR